MEIIFYIYLTIFIVANISKFFAIKNSLNNTIEENEDNFISIVIAAKNEEENLHILFESLKKLSYPKEKYEIIFINDNSLDNSKKIAESFLSELINLKVIDAVNKKYPGKKGAIDTGIKNAKYTIIAVTDADCFPSENWLKIISSSLIKNDLFVGLSPFIQRENLVNEISSFENFRNSMLGIWFHNLGFIFSATARNLAFKKELYFNINGFNGISKTLSGDDDLFIQKAVKNNYKVFYSTAKQGAVYSNSETDFENYFKQKKRHLSTIPFYSFKIKFLLFLFHYLNIAMLFTFFVGFFAPYYFILPVIKFSTDLITNKYFQNKFGYNFRINKLLVLIPIYEIFLIINYFQSKFGKVNWK